jgi:excinuclease UvrABC nuclease subunit
MCNIIPFEKITLEWVKYLQQEIPTLPGVYQIYGDSPVYGTNTLLYIGKAKNLYNRIINNHEANIESFITRQPNISYRYATVDSDHLNVVEQILIVMHKPSFNSANIININSEIKKQYYYIQNHGERGMLHLELTNFYFFDKNNKL